MQIALTASLVTALFLAAVCRAARPGGLLRFLAGWWESWLINRPAWLPGKPSGDCCQCTATWVPGVPVAVAVALLTPAGLWALCVPVLVGIIFELSIEKKS